MKRTILSLQEALLPPPPATSGSAASSSGHAALVRAPSHGWLPSFSTGQDAGGSQRVRVQKLRGSDVEFGVHLTGIKGMVIYGLETSRVLAGEKSFMTQTPAQLHTRLTSPATTLLLAWWEDQLIGFAAYGEEEGLGTTYLYELHVHHGHQRRGVGSALFQYVANEAKVHTQGKMHLVVHRENSDARRLYLRLGMCCQEIQGEEMVMQSTPHPTTDLRTLLSTPLRSTDTARSDLRSLLSAPLPSMATPGQPAPTPARPLDMYSGYALLCDEDSDALPYDDGGGDGGGGHNSGGHDSGGHNSDGDDSDGDDSDGDERWAQRWAQQQWADSSGDDSDGDESDGDESDGDNSGSGTTGEAKAKVRSTQLWGRAHFPMGYSPPSRWDMKNLQAALVWECPCSDRPCLAVSGRQMDVIQLYDLRRSFHNVCAGGGNQRDTLRKQLELHYDGSLFHRTFKVGNSTDCCAAAFAFASGVSWATFVRARADVTMDRPHRAVRKQRKTERQEAAKSQVNAYIRTVLNRLEGSKGGTIIGGKTKYFTAIKSGPRRYEDYVIAQNAAKRKVLCTRVKTFMSIWKEHTEIVEVSPTGHAICDTCGALAAQKLSLGARRDPAAMQRFKEIEEDERLHAINHKAPREIFDDATYTAEERPHEVTMINIDAPTRRQFDLPRQPTKSADTMKKLDTLKRWEQKVTGAMDAGVGMRVYFAHEAIGGGPNLVLTVLYLTIRAHIKSGRPLGRVLHIQLDNTCGENKCLAVIAFCGWLVLVKTFEEVIILCMLVGHTFTILDQSFNTMIDTMKRGAMPTVEAMQSEIFNRMREYNIQEVTELPWVWDFSSWLQPLQNRLSGFARRQAISGHYTGMSQFVFNADQAGEVRLRMRANVRASTWVPEGPGYPVFQDGCTLPSAPPKRAAFKTFAKWNRNTVEANVRRWLPYLGVNVQTQRAAEAAWEARLDALTGDVNSVVDKDNTMQWEGPLVPYRPQPQTMCDVAGGRIREPIENPPVNPIVGAGSRSEAQYAEEIHGWQTHTRLGAAAAGLPPPVHLGEYLIIRQAANKGLQLHQVRGGRLGVTDDRLDVSTTEYAAIPAAELSWGWGTFAPRRNELYNRSDRQSGNQYVCYEHMQRKHILLYDVATFVDSDNALRISLSSLQTLASKGTEVKIPAPLPPSHIDEDEDEDEDEGGGEDDDESAEGESGDDSSDDDFRRYEVTEHSLRDATFAEWRDIVGTDVCVLKEAFPTASTSSDDVVGWRGTVTKKRGSGTRRTQQVEVYGAWFSLFDTQRIKPVKPAPSLYELFGTDSEDDEGAQ
jgi:hypothetical protein